MKEVTIGQVIQPYQDIIDDLQSQLDNIEIRLEDIHSKYKVLNDFNRLQYTLRFDNSAPIEYLLKPNIDLFQLGTTFGKLEGIDGMLESILKDIKDMENELKDSRKDYEVKNGD